MTVEIQFRAWDMHNNVAGLNRLMGSRLFLLSISIEVQERTYALKLKTYMRFVNFEFAIYNNRNELNCLRKTYLKNHFDIPESPYNQIFTIKYP